MALPDEAVFQVGTAIVFADTTDHSPAAANNFGALTDQIDLTGLADGAARQGDKVDLLVSRAPEYSVFAAIEIAATPAAGSIIEFYWAPSPSATAANANPGGVSGADSAYTGVDSDLANSVKTLQYIGAMVCTNDPTAVIQKGFIGVFSPAERYGTPVVKNESGAALHSDAVEMSVLLSPISMKVID